MNLQFDFQCYDWLFLPFFAATYLVYLLVKGTRFRNLWIVVASYVFYGAMSPFYLVLITYATLSDYLITWVMENSARKKVWVVLSILNNVALLGYFKYAKFIAENVNILLAKANINGEMPVPGILLPIGLSFYIFKSLGYVLDCYRGTLPRERNLITFAAFVSFFPMLVAGPIERAGNLLGQLRSEPKITREDVSDGLSLFVTGLFKKLVLADGLAAFCNPMFKTPDDFTGSQLALGVFAFAWNIYFDFSGYSDMARGIARMWGFKIMLNFNNPYLATGLGDFWRRWHISLSSWFRDYVYIPLGGNRGGAFRTYFNMFATMVISGIWHGASWNFIIWGAVHGAGSCLTRGLERSLFYVERVPKVAKQIGCFLIVCFAWVFFKATTFAEACLILRKIFTSGFSDPGFPLIMVGVVAVAWIYQYLYESRVTRILNLVPVRMTLVVLMLLATFILAGASQPFAYEAF